MKKLLLFAVVGIALCVSCDKTPSDKDMAGTHWVNNDFFSDESFTSELFWLKPMKKALSLFHGSYKV